MFRDLSLKTVAIIALLVCYHLAASTIGLIIIKKALHATRFSLQMILDPRVLVGGALYFTSALTWFFILARFPLTFIYPILSGLSYVLVTVASILVLREKPDTVTIVGIVLILAGIVTITFKGGTV
jgi:multidrug transporter EmrE-like cation transporter